MTLTPEGATFTAAALGCVACKASSHAACFKARDLEEMGAVADADSLGAMTRCQCYDQNAPEHVALRSMRSVDSKAVTSCGLCGDELTFDQPGFVSAQMMQDLIGQHLRAKHPESLKQREGDQRLPMVSDEEDIQSRVIRDIEKRRQVGIQRYGTALQPFNGRSTLLDAYEESLDKTVYLKSLLVMREAMRGDLIDAATRAILKQWLENAESKIVDSPEGFSRQLGEIAVDAILDAFAENSPVVRQG